MLLGYNDDDVIEEKILRVTLAYNHFGKNLVQRMPRFCFQTVFVRSISRFKLGQNWSNLVQN